MKSLDNPKVSIITICYNANKFIEDTIKSVINQTYKNKEYIIIDGGSTDDSINILSTYSEQFASLIIEKDRGIFDAMNKGLSLANGDWVIFMNAGDSFYNQNVLEKIFHNPIPEDVALVYGNPLLFDQNDEYIFKSKTNRSKINLNAICHQAVFIKRELHLPFNLSYKLSADHDIIYKLIKEHNIVYFDLTVAKVLIGGVSSDLKVTRKEKLLISFTHGNLLDKFLALLFYCYGSIKHLAKFILLKIFPKQVFKWLRDSKNKFERGIA